MSEKSMKVWREGGVSIVLKEDRVVDGQEDGIKEDIEERGSGPGHLEKPIEKDIRNGSAGEIELEKEDGGGYLDGIGENEGEEFEEKKPRIKEFKISSSAATKQGGRDSNALKKLMPLTKVREIDHQEAYGEAKVQADRNKLKNQTQPIMRKFTKLESRPVENSIQKQNSINNNQKNLQNKLKNPSNPYNEPAVSEEKISNNSRNSNSLLSSKVNNHGTFVRSVNNTSIQKNMKIPSKTSTLVKQDSSQNDQFSNKMKASGLQKQPKLGKSQNLEQNIELEAQAKLILNSIRSQVEQDFDSVMKKYLSLQSSSKNGVIFFNSGDSHIVRALSRYFRNDN